MIYKGDIDELLSTYLDGQLGQRQQTEVKRLLKHDEQIADRLRYLQKCRALLQSLPKAQAPTQIVEQIKRRLESQAINETSGGEYYDKTEGAKHLFVRKFASVAAIVALALMLGGVVYTIVSPAPDSKAIVSDNWAKTQPDSISKDSEQDDVTAVKADDTVESAAKQAELKTFSGTLELVTAKFKGVDAYVKKSLVDNGIILIELPVSAEQKGLYRVRCSRAGLSMFLADLAAIWDKLDSATLRIGTDQAGGVVVVNNVTAQQIDRIAAEQDFAMSLELARNFGALNAISDHFPADGFLAASKQPAIGSLPIPKPVLTSSENNKTAEKKVEQGEIVELVIEVKNSQ